MEGAGYDVVGDLHGHAGQLHRLLAKLGYLKDSSGESYLHPDGRQVIFLGDFINRGPEVDEVLMMTPPWSCELENQREHARVGSTAGFLL